MNLKDTIALHTPATKRDVKAGGPGSGDLPSIQREIAQREANHLKVVRVHMPGRSHFSPTPHLGTPAKVGSGPKAPSGGPKMVRTAPRTGGRIGAGGPGSGRHPGFSKVLKKHGFKRDAEGEGYTKGSQGPRGGNRVHFISVDPKGNWEHHSAMNMGEAQRGASQFDDWKQHAKGSSVASLQKHLTEN